MKELKEKLEALKQLLHEIEALMQPHLDEQRRKEKHAQLRSVERSIVELQKSGTPVPDELRELKFRLVHEADLYKEYKAIQREVSNLLAPLVMEPQKPKTSVVSNQATKHSNPEQVRKISENFPAIVNPEPAPELKIPTIRSDKKASFRVTISDLVKAGLIPPGTEIQNKYKGRWYKATIEADGLIYMELNGKIEKYSSPSGAAVAASGKSQDGWVWWSLTGSHHAETLDYYRKKFLHSVNGTDEGMTEKTLPALQGLIDIKSERIQ